MASLVPYMAPWTFFAAPFLAALNLARAFSSRSLAVGPASLSSLGYNGLCMKILPVECLPTGTKFMRCVELNGLYSYSYVLAVAAAGVLLRWKLTDL